MTGMMVMMRRETSKPSSPPPPPLSLWPCCYLCTGAASCFWQRRSLACVRYWGPPNHAGRAERILTVFVGLSLASVATLPMRFTMDIPWVTWFRGREGGATRRPQAADGVVEMGSDQKEGGGGCRSVNRSIHPIPRIPWERAKIPSGAERWRKSGLGTRGVRGGGGGGGLAAIMMRREGEPQRKGQGLGSVGGGGGGVRWGSGRTE